MASFVIASEIYFVSYPEVSYNALLSADRTKFLSAVSKMASCEHMLAYARVISLQNSANINGSDYPGLWFCQWDYDRLE